MAKPKKEVVPSVSVTEFNDFKAGVEQTQGKMLDILEEMSKSKSVNPAVATAVQNTRPDSVSAQDAAPQQEVMPPQYQRLMDKYLDPADGFRGKLNFLTDHEGGGTDAITFTIFVPKKISNASEAHWGYYKQDERMTALKAENIGRGIETWSAKVAKNLNYNILMKRK